METIQKTALLFTITKAINWLFIKLFDFNIVKYLFTDLIGMDMIKKFIYIIVGICGLINIGLFFNHIEK